jgi:predicted CoA-binding protein
MQNPSDGEIAALLRGVRNIAVLGIKDDPREPAHRVPAYLQARGYRILPVSPKCREVLGERCAATLGELAEPADLVDVFRASQHIAGHADEILAMHPRPRAVWLQEGIRDDASAERLAEAGICVVQDRCLMVDHRRLLGAG